MNKEVKRRADVVGIIPNEPSIIRLIVLAQLRDLAFRDAGETHRLDQFIDPPGRHATDPGLLDYHNECLLGGLARLQERREVRALPQLGNAQAEWAESGVEAAIAVTVAVIKPVAGALVPAGADQAFDIGPIRICSTASATARRKSPSPLFCSSSTSAILSSVIGSFGHRGLGGCWWFSQLHRNAPSR
jgi:hypothetical protein